MNKIATALALVLAASSALAETFFREAGVNSVIVGPICVYDAAGKVVETTMDYDLANLVITITTPASATSFSYTGANIVNVTTPATWDNPASGKIGVDKVATGAHNGCVMLHLRDEVLDVANALEWGIGITDGGSAIMDKTAQILAVSSAGGIWDVSTSGHTTSGTFGEQLKTDVDAILVDTGTTLDAKLDTLVDADGSQFTAIPVASDGALNCEVDTAFFAATQSAFACELTDLADSPITTDVSTGDFTGKQVVFLSGAQNRESGFYIITSEWDATNTQLKITMLDRPLPAAPADAVVARIR